MIRLKKSYYRKSQPSAVTSFLIKTFLALLVLGAPVLALVLIFKPFVKQPQAERPVLLIDYRLPDGYQRKDITEQVKKMSEDPEYLFYFYSIDKDEIVNATREVFEILDRARHQQSLQKEMLDLQKKTQALATMFYHLEYSDEYLADPTAFPELQKVLKAFLYEEFKLAILGVSYKGTYDPAFRFEWDRTSRLAARKLHAILLRRKTATRP